MKRIFLATVLIGASTLASHAANDRWSVFDMCRKFGMVTDAYGLTPLQHCLWENGWALDPNGDLDLTNPLSYDERSLLEHWQAIRSPYQIEQDRQAEAAKAAEKARQEAEAAKAESQARLEDWVRRAHETPAKREQREMLELRRHIIGTIIGLLFALLMVLFCISPYWLAWREGKKLRPHFDTYVLGARQRGEEPMSYEGWASICGYRGRRLLTHLEVGREMPDREELEAFRDKTRRRSGLSPKS